MSNTIDRWVNEMEAVCDAYDINNEYLSYALYELIKRHTEEVSFIPSRDVSTCLDYVEKEIYDLLLA